MRYLRPVQQRLRHNLHLWLLGGLLITSSLLYTVLTERQPTGWDALGYQVAGRNIAQGIGPAIEHPFNGTLGPYFTLAAFAVQRPQEPARLYLNYPPGFPLLLATPQWLGLSDFVVLPILSTLGVLFTYLLGSLLLDHWAGLLGAVVVAFAPAYMEWGTSFWADLPGTCFMLGALTIYLIAKHQDSHLFQVLLSSISGTMAVWAMFIKYSNIAVLLPLSACIVLAQRWSVFDSKINWIFAVTIVLGLVGIGWYNQVVYGSPLTTSYSASKSYSFPFFSVSYALGPSPADGHSLIGAGKTLWENFTWLLIPALWGVTKAKREAVVLLGGMFLTFFVMSSTFAWAPVGVDTRYLLPLFAPVGLFAARGCLSMLDLGLSRRKLSLGVVLIAVAVTSAVTLSTTWRRLVERNRQSSQIKKVAQNLTSGSEPDAVFLAYSWNDPINYFGERATFFYRRVDLADRPKFENTLTQVVTGLLQIDRPVYYVVDSQPSFANSLQVLQQNFDLELWKETPFLMYQVASKE